MKKIITVISIIICVLLFAVGCTATGTNGYTYSLHFGQFGYKGRMLPEYAVASISAEEAKGIITDQKSLVRSQTVLPQKKVVFASINSVQKVEPCLPTESIVNQVLQKYSDCIVTTKYYVEGKSDVQTKEDRLMGTDFKYTLQQNQFVPFNQLVAKNVLIFDDLIDYMEEQNRVFEQSEAALIAPFRAIFTYHTDNNGNLVVQTHDFAEIPSSIGGGIGCSYRQDTEIVYDAEGKMSLWQTSLGLYSSSPQGTMQDGYILEMSVKWIEKE